MHNKKPKIVASIEARMSSSRLPGKVLEKIGEYSALEFLIKRLQRSKTLDDIIVATTDSPEDIQIVELCNKMKINYFCGSKNNVLNRVVEAHKSLGTDVIVEITGDCPLTDPNIVDIGVETFLLNDCDMVTNCEKENFLEGIYVQVFNFSALDKVDREIKDPAVQEHVSLYFYENPKEYKVIHLGSCQSYNVPFKCRTQLDYPEDLIFIRELVQRLVPKYGIYFSIEDITRLLIENPQLVEINKNCHEKPVR